MAWGELGARAHIQNFTDANASNTQHHWGYADRIVPCTSDAGSCEYLDVVYHAHDVGILCTGIFWASILGILLIWGIWHRASLARRYNEAAMATIIEESQRARSGVAGVGRLRQSLSSLRRHFLLPDFAPRVLGHVTRLQVTVLLVLSAYLAILSFIGIVYKMWITPVKGYPELHNTRTSLGPFADRVGVLAYALTPLSVLLASRESLLSLITEIPYQSFLFLHRWVGHIILIQSVVHTIGWVVVEAALYQPQPAAWDSLAAELYIQWGFVALGLLVLLWVFATPLGIRLTGYEVFRKVHYVLAMVYIGAVIGHWEQLQCFLIPGILLWFFDRMCRLIRTGLLHYRWLPSKGKWGFESAQARISYWADESAGDVVRLDFEHPQQPWAIGQHFYLCFPKGSIWQSHPMTPLSLPAGDESGRVQHSYVIRAKAGETKKLAQIAAVAMGDEKNATTGAATTKVIMTGPYGVDMASDLTPDTNVLCIAGGTGITFVLPVLLKLVRDSPKRGRTRKIDLVWAVRRDADAQWVEKELEEIQDAGCSQGVNVDIFVTREKGRIPASSDSSSKEVVTAGCDCNDVSHHHPSDIEVPDKRRPHLDNIVTNFVDSVAQGPVVVYASGPGSMIGDLRRAVAARNEAGKVWRGDNTGTVRLICDDRLE
ncbi:ferric reductase NAD binding domain-domain-containing protein [Coniella lustricola]|uniref:Ferric reductase NAD binding domain-domain-containing protein n=1 Tax=Coniella lustricola TaxID=2025994 RepID=A0A2T3AI21_9PEZI|nr:ferric reductase NAD binding domain-domain-containing protein [Coniella lustricola]